MEDPMPNKYLTQFEKIDQEMNNKDKDILYMDEKIHRLEDEIDYYKEYSKIPDLEDTYLHDN